MAIHTTRPCPHNSHIPIVELLAVHLAVSVPIDNDAVAPATVMSPTSGRARRAHEATESAALLQAVRVRRHRQHRPAWVTPS